MSFWCWCSSWERFSSTEWSARPGSLPKEVAGGEEIMSVFLYSLGAVQVGPGNVFATLGYIFSSTFATLFLLNFIFQYSYRYQFNSWELVTLWIRYNSTVLVEDENMKVPNTWNFIDLKLCNFYTTFQADGLTNHAPWSSIREYSRPWMINLLIFHSWQKVSHKMPLSFPSGMGGKESLICTFVSGFFL